MKASLHRNCILRETEYKSDIWAESISTKHSLYWNLTTLCFLTWVIHWCVAGDLCWSDNLCCGCRVTDSGKVWGWESEDSVWRSWASSDHWGNNLSPLPHLIKVLSYLTSCLPPYTKLCHPLKFSFFPSILVWDMTLLVLKCRKFINWVQSFDSGNKKILLGSYSSSISETGLFRSRTKLLKNIQKVLGEQFHASRSQIPSRNRWV